jgi:hypothetical protein
MVSYGDHGIGKGPPSRGLVPNIVRRPMARSVGRLVPERMETGALWDHIETLSWRLRWTYGLNAREREAVLDQLQDCVHELKDRSLQLDLPFEDQVATSK